MPCAIIGNMKGVKGDPGRDADPVVGIKSINNTRNEGLQHYYRITLTDDTYFDFVVTDGEDAVVDLTIDTPSQVLAKIKNVDGSGSGLDADLLDGKDSSYFAKAEDIEKIAEVEHIALHSKIHIYKWGSVVFLTFNGWPPNTNIRDASANTNLTIPQGFKPPKAVFIMDVNQKALITISEGGGITQWINSALPQDGTISGSVTWITLE